MESVHLIFNLVSMNVTNGDSNFTSTFVSTNKTHDEYNDKMFYKYATTFKVVDVFLIVYSIFVVIIGSIFNIINFACFYRMKKR